MKVYLHFSIITILLSVLCFSCSKDDIFVPAEEPKIENPGDEATIVGNIDVSVMDLRDTDLFLKWYPVENATSYEISINDTMIISDGIIKSDYLDYYYFRISNLQSNSNYKITLRAITKDLNVKSSIILVKTKKSFIDKIITIPIDFQEFDPTMWSPFYKYINTSDGGSAIVGSLSKNGSTYTSLIKLTSSYDIQWICNIKGNSRMIPHEPTMDLIECSDNSFVVINYYSISKINQNGNILWQISNLNNENRDVIEYLSSAVELPDNSLLVVGNSDRNWGQLSVGIEGLIARISKDGKIEWKKYYHSSIENMFEKIVLKNDGNLFVAGTRDINNANYQSLSDIRKAICIVEMTQNGDALKEMIYKYQQEPSDEYASLNNLIAHDGYYYIVGGVTYDYFNTFLVKIDNNGSILWQRRGHEDGEYSSNISISGLGNKSIFMYSFVSSQTSILKEVGFDGDIVNEVNFTKFPEGYPNGIYCGQDKDGRFIYTTVDAQVLFVNLDGYKSE